MTRHATDIIAYTYEADYHCIACTVKRFSDDGKVHGTEEDRAKFRPCTDDNGIWYETTDSEGNLVHPVFVSDEWQEFDEGFLSENPTQYLACGNCHEVIEEYTHQGE